MRHTIFIAALAVAAALCGRGSAQDRPGIHRLDSFMATGVFTELDRAQTQHRLGLREIEKQHLDGRPVDLSEPLELMARYEKLRSRIEEPREVHGRISMSLPANALGEEAYTTCFCALTYNGLAFSGAGNDLVLVRPEKHPRVELPKRPWNTERILAARLYRLGFLDPDPIMRRYRDEIGTPEGHLIFLNRANVLIVVDSELALESLRAAIDGQVLEAMGVAAADGGGAARAVGPPRPGAVAAREAIHFYLTTFARWHKLPLVAERKDGAFARYYPEMDLWTSERGFRALQQEYGRVNELVRVAREEGVPEAEGPDPTLSPERQRSLDIRFGVVTPLPRRPGQPPTRKAARQRR
jgi:hypothetical protein